MADTLTRETLDQLDAYCQRREAEWSRGMDCEQAIAEPDERCTVTIWELQQLIVEARRTVPGLVQYNALMTERDTARRERKVAAQKFDESERITLGYVKHLHKAEAEREEARAMLQKLEWSWFDRHGRAFCATCTRQQAEGHAADCAHAKAIKETT